MYGVPVLGHVIGLLPGMSQVAFYRYATTSLELSVIVLAALGLDDVIRNPEHRRRVVWAALVSLALVAAAAIGARPLIHELGPRFARRPYYIGAVGWGIVIALGAVAAGLMRNPRRRAVLLVAVVCVDALALFVAPELSAPRSVNTDLAPAAYLQRHLGTSRFFTLGPLQPNYGSYFAIAQLNANDLPVPSAFEHFVRARLDRVVDPTLFVGNYGGDGRCSLPPRSRSCSATSRATVRRASPTSSRPRARRCPRRRPRSPS